MRLCKNERLKVLSSCIIYKIYTITTVHKQEENFMTFVNSRNSLVAYNNNNVFKCFVELLTYKTQKKIQKRKIDILYYIIICSMFRIKFNKE